MMNPNDGRSPQHHVIRMLILGVIPYFLALSLFILGQMLPVDGAQNLVFGIELNWRTSVSVVLYSGLIVLVCLAMAAFTFVLRYRLLWPDIDHEPSGRRWAALLNLFWLVMVLTAIIAGFSASLVMALEVGSWVTAPPFILLCVILLVSLIYRLAPYFDSIGRDFDDEVAYRLRKSESR